MTEQQHLRSWDKAKSDDGSILLEIALKLAPKVSHWASSLFFAELSSTLSKVLLCTFLHIISEYWRRESGIASQHPRFTLHQCSLITAHLHLGIEFVIVPLISCCVPQSVVHANLAILSIVVRIWHFHITVDPWTQHSPWCLSSHKNHKLSYSPRNRC